MIDLQLAKQLKELFGEFIQATPQEIRVNCPKCQEKIGKIDNKHHLYINTYKEAWNCFRCNWKGVGFKNLGIEVQEQQAAPVNDLLGFFKIKQKELNINLENAMTTTKEELKEIEYPKGYTTEFSASVIGLAALNFLKSRNITDEQIKKHRIGYANSGPYKGFIILPVLNNNKLVYYVARSIFNKQYKNASIPNKNILFNYSNQKSVVLCEGIFDALSFNNNGVALLGKSLKEGQKNIIINNPPEKLYICLDSDARANAIQIAGNLKKYIDNIYLIDLGEYKDPNSCPKKYLIEAIKSAILVNDQVDILKYTFKNVTRT